MDTETKALLRRAFIAGFRVCQEEHESGRAVLGAHEEFLGSIVEEEIQRLLGDESVGAPTDSTEHGMRAARIERAAPDLLAAALTVVALEEMPPLTVNDFPPRDREAAQTAVLIRRENRAAAMEALRAAIAKAEGRA